MQDNAKEIFQSFINFDGFPVNRGITTTGAGDFHCGGEAAEEEHLNFLYKMGKNALARVIPQHEDEIMEINDLPYKLNYYQCDAIIWPRPENASLEPILTCPTADCPIVTVSNKELTTLGIIHSGRASTELQIAPQVIEILKGEYSIPPHKLQIGIWPGICSGCYTVDKESAQGFLSKTIKEEEDLVYLDLKQEIKNQLLDQNIPPENISTLRGYCSNHSVENGKSLFYSYRRDETPGKTSGRNLVYISR